MTLPPKPDVEQAWAEEIRRRVAEVEAGTAELVPGEQVFAEVRAQLRDRMSAGAQPRCTPEQYLALERVAEHRSEYVDGRIRPLPLSNLRHNLIVGNLLAEMWAQLRGRDGSVCASNMRIKVSPTGLYTYPDALAFRGAPQFEGDQEDILLNPSVIVEVLSDSTERYDRGEKFAHYRRLESLREYVLVSQHRMRVELLVRQGEHWVLSELDGPDAVLPLESVGCSIPLGAIYEQVDLPRV